MSIFNSIYKYIHTSPRLADLVYHHAYWIHDLHRKWIYKQSNKITSEELFKYRSIDSGTCMQICVTNICNAKCTFCAYPKVISSKTLSTGVMDEQTFKDVIDEWISLGGKIINVTPAVGDPLVDPGILNKLKYAKQMGITGVYLTTNAILLHKFYKELIDMGISIFISTQGTNKDIYKKIYGVDQYSIVIENVYKMLQYNHEKGERSEIIIRFRNHEKPSEIIKSQDFQSKIKPFLSDKIKVNFTVDFDNWGGTITDKDISGNMRLRKLPAKINVPCANLFSYYIRHDGKVRACGCRLVSSDDDDLVIGNIKTESIKSLSTGPKFWQMIQGFYEGKRPKTCEECTFYRPIDKQWMQHRIKL